MSISVTYGSEWFTTTASNHLDKVRSNQFRNCPVAVDFLSKAKNVQGGDKLVIPFDVQEHSVTTQVTTGYEAADTTVQTIFEPGHDSWAFNIRPVIYSWVDEAKNGGAAQRIDIVKSRVENTALALEQQLEKRLMRFAAVPQMSDLNTLNGDDESDGFLENTALLSQNNTVHNISKSTYAALVGFQNQRYDVVGDASANLVAAVAHVPNRIVQSCRDPQQIAGYCSFSGAENYFKLAQAQAQYGAGQTDIMGGQLAVKIAGMTFKQSAFMPNAGTVTGAGNDEWSFLFIDHKVVQLQILKGLKFQMTPWRDVGGGHEAKLCFFKFAGQLTISDWRSSGIIFGADTY